MKKKTKWIIISALLLLILIAVVLFLIFGRTKTYVITIDDLDGTPISSIEIKDGEIIKLPDAPVKEGYKFVGWVSEEKKVVTPKTKITADLTIKPLWIEENQEIATISFNSDDGSEAENILVEKGKIINLPIDPIKEGYIFAGWITENGNMITKNTKIEDNIILKALWINKDAKIVTAKFETDGGSEVENIIVEKGKIINLPIAPTKLKYIFVGWVDSLGNPITKDTIVNENITLKALWKEAYTCPKDCKVSDDGKTCTKELTTNTTTVYVCPSGYKLINGKCLNVTTQIMVEYVDVCPDGSAPVSALCTNIFRVASSSSECQSKEYFQSGKCIMTANVVPKCPDSSYHIYTEVENMGAIEWCAKGTSKVATSGCPSGYTKDGNICKKTQTLNCTAN